MGYAAGILFSGLAGFLNGKISALNETFGNFLVGLRALPAIAWLPPAILWWGHAERAIVPVVAAAVFFPVAITVAAGLKNVVPVYLRAGLGLGARGT